MYVNLEPPIHWFANIEYLYRFMTCLENYFFHVVDDNKLFSVLLHCALKLFKWQQSKTNELGVLDSIPSVFNCCVSVMMKPVIWGRRRGKGWTVVSPLRTLVSSFLAIMLLGPLKGFKMVYWSQLPWWRHIVLPLYITVFCFGLIQDILHFYGCMWKVLITLITVFGSLKLCLWH